MAHKNIINFYGKMMIDMAKELYPINRSITGEGVRKTLDIIREKVTLKKKFFKSGKKVFDWIIPKEWNIKSAYILDLKDNKKYANFNENNLHIVGYSKPINKTITLGELKKHIHIDKKNKNAIPYVTSYYRKTWGFCLSQNQLRNMDNKKYKVIIDSSLKNGVMDYGEIVFKGRLKKEILFSTYICHPSMANNELSGPVINAALINYVNSLKNKKYSYRFVFVPETIGSIAYINKNLKKLKNDMLAGFIIHCAGDNRDYSFVQTPQENTFADKIMKSSFIGLKKKTIYGFKDRSSDERQYCSPGVELPVCSFSRSKAGSQTFPEYHTSLDNFNLVTQKGLEGSFELFKNIIDALELNSYPKAKNKCEPFLTKRNMYPTTSKKDNIQKDLRSLLNILAYSNGKRSVFEISIILNLKLETCLDILKRLKVNNLIY
jgi:aminopeptidase-like protein